LVEPEVLSLPEQPSSVKSISITAVVKDNAFLNLGNLIK